MRLKKRVEKVEEILSEHDKHLYRFDERFRELEKTTKALQEQINIISELIEPLVLQKAEKEMRESANELCKFFEELFGKDNAGKKQRPKSRVKTSAQPETKEKRGRGRPRKETK